MTAISTNRATAQKISILILWLSWWEENKIFHVKIRKYWEGYHVCNFNSIHSLYFRMVIKRLLMTLKSAVAVSVRKELFALRDLSKSIFISISFLTRFKILIFMRGKIRGPVPFSCFIVATCESKNRSWFCLTGKWFSLKLYPNISILTLVTIYL